jgi:hypothetical protein
MFLIKLSNIANHKLFYKECAMIFRRFFILVSVLVLLAFSSSVAKVIAEENDCSPEAQAMTGVWKAVAAQILIERDLEMQKATGDLPKAFALQSLRRCFDQQWRLLGEKRTPSDEEIYWVLQNALNLTVDSIISAQLDKAAAAESLTTQASEQYAVAAELIGLPPKPTITPDPAATIDIPTNESVVPQETQVSGTYASSLLSPDNQLWLLVVTPGGLIFPQANNACATDPNVKREPIPFDLLGGSNTWTMVIGVGGNSNIGEKFRLLLVTADAGVSTFFNEWFDTGCAKNDFPGLTQSQIVSHGKITVLQTVNVTRQ